MAWSDKARAAALMARGRGRSGGQSQRVRDATKFWRQQARSGTNHPNGPDTRNAMAKQIRSMRKAGVTVYSTITKSAEMQKQRASLRKASSTNRSWGPTGFPTLGVGSRPKRLSGVAPLVKGRPRLSGVAPLVRTKR